MQCLELPIDKRTRYADGPEKSNEDGLAYVFDLMDPFVHSEDNWEASEQKNQNSKRYQARDRDIIVMEE